MRQIPALVGLSVLLLSGCGRHREARARASESVTPAGAPVTRIASQSGSLAVLTAERPSPFANLPEADRETLTEPAPSNAAPPKEKPAGKPLKKFSLAGSAPAAQAVRSSIAPRLPPPPELTQPATGASALPFTQKACCLGTATAEPARPARVQRMLGKVPGIRRLRHSPATEEGFVSARPRRTITMMLPPETRSVLPEGSMELKASVNEAGGVTRVELLSPKDEELIRLSAYAASDWSFVPARVNDKPVPSEVILHFDFRGN